MKKLLLLLGIAAMSAAMFSCNSDENERDVWTTYAEWRETNNSWLEEMQGRTNADGTPYYKVLIPAWNPGSFVLIHYFNDRAETEGNLSPLYTSTIDVRYYGYLYNDEPFDSSANLNTSAGPGIFRTQLNSTIQGWSAALSDMRVKDTAEVIIPYAMGYGASGAGSVIPPYSNLRFNVRLHDIYLYEATPY